MSEARFLRSLHIQEAKSWHPSFRYHRKIAPVMNHGSGHTSNIRTQQHDSRLQRKCAIAMKTQIKIKKTGSVARGSQQIQLVRLGPEPYTATELCNCWFKFSQLIKDHYHWEWLGSFSLYFLSLTSSRSQIKIEPSKGRASESDQIVQQTATKLFNCQREGSNSNRRNSKKKGSVARKVKQTLSVRLGPEPYEPSHVRFSARILGIRLRPLSSQNCIGDEPQRLPQKFAIAVKIKGLQTFESNSCGRSKIQWDRLGSVRCTSAFSVVFAQTPPFDSGPSHSFLASSFNQFSEHGEKALYRVRKYDRVVETYVRERGDAAGSETGTVNKVDTRVLLESRIELTCKVPRLLKEKLAVAINTHKFGRFGLQLARSISSQPLHRTSYNRAELTIAQLRKKVGIIVLEVPLAKFRPGEAAPMRVGKRTVEHLMSDYRKYGTAAHWGPDCSLRGQKRKISTRNVEAYTNVLQCQFLRGYIRFRNDPFLQELKDLLEERVGVEVSDSTVWRTLNCTGFTMKKTLEITRHAVERNEGDQRSYKFSYGRTCEPETTVFVDESSFDRRTVIRNRGWALKGRRAERKCFFVRGKR
ncbi:hypothetical protein C8R44DRAFT_739952 [Mycena epipterygia]|nr:hypothetical protein C8R44DRAFT_739952 [Mycena epipterygia]